MLGELFLEEQGLGVCLTAKLAWNPQSSCLSLNNELSRGALMAKLKDERSSCLSLLHAGLQRVLPHLMLALGVWSVCCIYVQPSAHGGTG